MSTPLTKACARQFKYSLCFKGLYTGVRDWNNGFTPSELGEKRPVPTSTRYKRVRPHTTWSGGKREIMSNHCLRRLLVFFTFHFNPSGAISEKVPFLLNMARLDSVDNKRLVTCVFVPLKEAKG